MEKEEAIKILKNFHDKSALFSVRTALETLYPELAESEDEVIRKEIILFIQDDVDEINLKVRGDYDDRDEDDIAHQNWCKKAISWLENIPYTIDHEKREGFYLGYKAALEKQGDSPIKWNKNTEDCKPKVNHSVLMKTTQGIAEGEWKGEYWEQYRWAGIIKDSDVLSWIELSDLEEQGKQKPTLRERYKNIAESEWFKKTHEGMSVFDDEKVDNVNKIEQKPSWSEEDETRLQACLDTLQANSFMGRVDTTMTKWLKSLKNRIKGE